MVKFLGIDVQLPDIRGKKIAKPVEGDNLDRVLSGIPESEGDAVTAWREGLKRKSDTPVEETPTPAWIKEQKNQKGKILGR